MRDYRRTFATWRTARELGGAGIMPDGGEKNPRSQSENGDSDIELYAAEDSNIRMLFDSLRKSDPDQKTIGMIAKSAIT